MATGRASSESRGSGGDGHSPERNLVVSPCLLPSPEEALQTPQVTRKPAEGDRTTAPDGRSGPRSIHSWRVVHCPKCYTGRYVALDLPRPECSSFLCRVGSEERSGVEGHALAVITGSQTGRDTVIRSLSGTAPAAGIKPGLRPSLPTTSPTADPDPALNRTHRLVSKADLAGVIPFSGGEMKEQGLVIGRIVALASGPCPGPAGLARSWPCAHPDGFGHEGDHERFARPDEDREQTQKELVLAEVRALREERDALRAACSDALACFERMDLLDGRPGRYRPIKEILREAINKVTR